MTCSAGSVARREIGSAFEVRKVGDAVVHAPVVRGYYYQVGVALTQVMSRILLIRPLRIACVLQTPCRGGPPWPPPSIASPRARGGHGGPSLQEQFCAANVYINRVKQSNCGEFVGREDRIELANSSVAIQFNVNGVARCGRRLGVYVLEQDCRQAVEIAK